ncbi:winged helix-turn-helix domain-containing protein [Klebsiella sp. R445]
MNLIKVLLKDDIIYRPDLHCVSRCDDIDSRVMLALPASLCFLLLLENKGEVVSHAEFYSAVWEVRGVNATSNTLYQNISILRKALSSFGIADDFIKTIPKRGFMIKDSPDIKMIREDNETQHKSSDNATLPLDNNIDSTKKKPLLYVKVAILMMLMVTISISLSSFVTTYFYKEKIPTYVAPVYIQLSNAGKCNVFRNKTLMPDSFYYRFIEENNINCTKPEWVYIINYPPSHKVSLIRCNKPLFFAADNGKALCLSNYYLDGVGGGSDK